jgi:hypothetical protein
MFLTLLTFLSSAQASSPHPFTCNSELRVLEVSPSEEEMTFTVSVRVTQGWGGGHDGCVEGNTLEIEHKGEPPSPGDLGAFNWIYVDGGMTIGGPDIHISTHAVFYPVPERCVLEADPGAKYRLDPETGEVLWDPKSRKVFEPGQPQVNYASRTRRIEGVGWVSESELTDKGFKVLTEPSSQGCPAIGTFLKFDFPAYTLGGHRYRLEGTLSEWTVVQRVGGLGRDTPGGKYHPGSSLHATENLAAISPAWLGLPAGACVFTLRVKDGELKRGVSSTYGCWDDWGEAQMRALSPWPPAVLEGLAEGLHWFRLEGDSLVSFEAP